ncbi:DUF523 domain-containing protein [Candidatus Poribacteria bacterium]|nr:DUF523 domain-containing protein [Candidatus Poribacteria bacterium]MYH81461.1 DUF523 domain-containing protein [Candidatus Poribacteria bacterium]MYK93054.1 DUF523 domain-containing protein [Candidatus Poribacteria bacterium]
MKVVVSACLLGVRCRYDGGDSRNESAIKQKETDDLIPVCPEEAGGLPTLRPPAEIVGGDGDDVLNGKAKVMTADGTDVTAAYLKGAHHALQVAQSHGATQVILKARSPSCGCGAIYDGSFSGTLTTGDGVTTALLKRHGIAVTSM